MKWLNKLNNPFLLGLEGFLAGAILFFATHPDAANTIVDRGSQPAQEQARRAA